MGKYEQLHNIINTFFDGYADALEHFDTKGMANHYAIPCSFLSDQSSQAFNDASKLEGLFNQGVGFYKQYGVVHARPDIWSKRSWTNRMVKAKVNWRYYDKDNKFLYDCDYQYIVKLDKHDKWKIEVAVSINEKEKMEEWLQNK